MKTKTSWFLKAELVVLLCILVLRAAGVPTKAALGATASIFNQAIKMPSNSEFTHELLENTHYGSNAMAGLGKLKKL